MITDEKKSLLMAQCVEWMPKQWRIANQSYERLAVLGKGSWAVAFSARRLDPRVESGVQASEADTAAADLLFPSVSMIPFEHRIRLVSKTIDSMGEWIAVKAIIKEAHNRKSMEKYPQREVDLLRRLTGHRNVIKLYAYWQDERCFYLAMELCPNRSLSSVIKSSEPLPLSSAQAKAYLLQMLHGLGYVHAHLIIHRDIKPDNVLLSRENALKISDFGLSTSVPSAAHRITSICGTPKYQAPEIIRKTGYSFPVDIWAVGCIYYRLHYGVAPFDGPRSAEIYEKLLSAHIAYPRYNRFNRRLSEPELRLMRWMLKKNPGLRGTIAELLEHQFLQGKAAKEKQHFAPSGRRTYEM